MNPMGKNHVTALLDAYLAMDGDGIAARATAEASARLADVPGDLKVGLVVVDDLMGGGSNRYDCEFFFRLGPNQLGGGSTEARTGDLADQVEQARLLRRRCRQRLSAHVFLLAEKRSWELVSLQTA